MKIEEIKISDIKPAEYNPRKIQKEELDKLAQDHQIKMTMPVFLEADGIIQRAIEIGHEMTGGILR